MGEDGPGARAHGREGCLVESLGIKFTDPAAGSAQEVAQALGPGVAVGVLDEPEVAQQVGTAQGVLTVISGEGAGPSVVDQNATRAGDDTQVVDGGATAPSVDELHPQVPGTDAVHPVVRAIDAQAGLVGVQGGHGQQTVDGCGFPVGQRLVQAHQPGQQGRLGHGAPGQGLEGLRGAPERHHLGSHEMRGEGQDAVAVLQRSRHIVREGAPALGSAARAGRDLGLDPQLAGLEQDVHQDPPLMAVRGDIPKTATAGAAFGDRCGPRLHDQAVGPVPGGAGLRPRARGTGARAGGLVGLRPGARQPGGARTLRSVLLHEHRHQHLKEHQQSFDQGAALGAHRAVRTQRLEARLECVELRAQRRGVDRRHGLPGPHRQALRWRHQRDQRLTHSRCRIGTEICVVHGPVQ